MRSSLSKNYLLGAMVLRSIPTPDSSASSSVSIRTNLSRALNDSNPLTILVRFASSSGAGRSPLPPPPPLGASRSSKLPPPPPLMSRRSENIRETTGSNGAAATGASVLPWQSPQEVLTCMVEFIPTFYVPSNSVAAILDEEARQHLTGKGKFVSFLRRYRFFFDIRLTEGGSRCDVKLREDVNHPRKGAADEKYMITDVGEVTNYIAKPEFVVSTESIENSTNERVLVKQQMAPPAVHVRLEESVPILEELKALVPREFVDIDQLESEIPETILFHPYFDCQGGLASIASKFPEYFQVVSRTIRLRPPYLAPLALNDYTLDSSPIPDVAKLVKEQVCSSEIPHWVSMTSLYEQLTREQKKQIKHEFKSFAGFLRSHGRSLSISQDILQVSKWIPPPLGSERKPTLAEKSAATATAKSEVTSAQTIKK